MDSAKRPRIQSPEPRDDASEQIPPGWEVHFSERKQRTYYYHTKTGTTQWTKPEPARPQTPPSTPPDSPRTTVDSPPYDPTKTDDLDSRAPYDPCAATMTPNFQFAPPPSTSIAAESIHERETGGLVIDENDAYGDVAYSSRFEDRNASNLIALRRTCNFLKEGLIRAAISVWSRVACYENVHVVDFACGRGGDFDKYRRAARDAQIRLTKLAGVEVSTGAYNVAVDRLNKMIANARDLDGVMTEGHLFKADLQTGDTLGMLHNHAEKRPGVTERFLHPGTYHIASCMFALHYFYFSTDVIQDLCRTTSYLLHDGGIFIAIYADGQAVARAYQAAKSKGNIQQSSSKQDPRESFQVGHAWVRMHPATVAYLNGDPRVGRHHFDRAYDFDLPGSVNDVTEYMVHPMDRDEAFRAAGLVPVLDEPAPQLLAAMLNLPFWQDAYKKCKLDGKEGTSPVDSVTMEQVSLYRAVVCVKSSSMMSDIPLARQAVRRVLGLEDAFIAPSTTT